MTNNGQRTIDIDSNQQQQVVMTNNNVHYRGNDTTIANKTENFPLVRSQRRLHKWSNDKTDELNAAADEDGDDDDDNDMSDAVNDENAPLVQSLSAMASHLMNTKEDDEEENLENSSERDVYITEKGHGVTVPNDDHEGGDSDTEETASEEDSTDHADVGLNSERKHGSNNGDLNDMGGEEVDDNEDDKLSPKLKSDHYSTTPKGLTTWSDVNGPSQTPMYSSKVTVQKTRPLEYTISSVLSFSTERPTTQEMVVIKERVTSTESTNRITSKVNLMSPSSSSSVNNSKHKRRPYNKTNKKVLPSKFVKAPLEDVTAEVTSIDDTHVVYKTKVTTDAPEMKSTGVTDYYDRFTTKKPMWPYQMTTRRVITKRPVPFSRVTAKPKYPYGNKKPQGSMTSPTTTTPATTTTYLRNPQTSMISPISGLTLSLTDMPFMDFVRSQIIPRIGLTLISFMASTPLLLSLLGAAGLRRRKRSLASSADFSSFNGKALFEATPRRRTPVLQQNPEHFDFSTIQKKLEEALMKQPTRRRNGVAADGTPTNNNSFDIITEAFRQLARWWTIKSAPPKSRTVNNDNQGKHKRGV